MGYPHSQKGCRLHNIEWSNKFFVSRDVKFYENIFPFTNFKTDNQPCQERPLCPNNMHLYTSLIGITVNHLFLIMFIPLNIHLRIIHLILSTQSISLLIHKMVTIHLKSKNLLENQLEILTSYLDKWLYMSYHQLCWNNEYPSHVKIPPLGSVQVVEHVV